ncbi:MAG: hypothetical protein FWG85_00590 [Bacteroidetes bacterium]|nr:hypothetical protein [Bacteroidota bacterium]
MKSFPIEAKKIKITFNCDLCGVDVTTEADVPSNETLLEVVCPVCYKNFSVKILPTGIEVEDLDDSDIDIEVLV